MKNVFGILLGMFLIMTFGACNKDSNSSKENVHISVNIPASPFDVNRKIYVKLSQSCSTIYFDSVSNNGTLHAELNPGNYYLSAWTFNSTGVVVDANTSYADLQANCGGGVRQITASGTTILLDKWCHLPGGGPTTGYCN